MRLIDSSISVPPRSFTPQRSDSVAASRPIFTQLAWTLRMLPAEREAEHRRVLEVLLARDLLDPVGAARASCGTG